MAFYLIFKLFFILFVLKGFFEQVAICEIKIISFPLLQYVYKKIFFSSAISWQPVYKKTVLPTPLNPLK